MGGEKMFLDWLNYDVTTYEVKENELAGSTVYITSDKVEYCLVCWHSLTERQVLVPVSEESSVIVRGLYCYGCNIFYGEKDLKPLFTKNSHAYDIEVECVKLPPKHSRDISVNVGQVLEDKKYGKGRIVRIDGNRVGVDFEKNEEGIVDVSFPSVYSGAIMRLTFENFVKEHKVTLVNGRVVGTEAYLKRGKKDTWESLDEWLKVSELAKFTGFSKEGIRKRCEKGYYENGDCKAIRQGPKGIWLIPKNSVPEEDRIYRGQ